MRITILTPWLSKAAEQLRKQINDSFENRSHKSDGWIADLRHNQAGKSDHIPDESAKFVVRAIDVDASLSDNKGDSAYLADQIRQYGKSHGRLSYIIHLGRIASPLLNWKWRTYKGFSPHNHHIHCSFRKDQDLNSEFFDIPMLGGKV